LKSLRRGCECPSRISKEVNLMDTNQFSEETQGVIKDVTDGVGNLMEYALREACKRAVTVVYQTYGIKTMVTYDKITYQVTLDTDDLIKLDKKLNKVTDARIGFDRKKFETMMQE
jgi:uncharacterized membrane protein (Fun14 family)